MGTVAVDHEQRLPLGMGEVWQAKRLASVEVQFLAEAHHGAAILSRLSAAGEGALAHVIVREEDEKELARLATAWVPREPAPAR